LVVTGDLWWLPPRSDRHSPRARAKATNTTKTTPREQQPHKVGLGSIASSLQE
jgi:hypothetical protein